MVIPGTWIFPDDPRIKLADKRGLIVTQPHAMALGVNVARWPPNVPCNFTAHPKILERAWRNAVAEYDPHQRILREVGLRGLSDESYAALDPSVRGNDARLGAVIGKAIDAEIRIVRAAHPHAQFVTSFWQEGARLEHEGDLRIPRNVIRVWADRGYGIPQDDGDLAPGEGVYCPVAMINGSANHLTEMIPVHRIYAQLGRCIKARATAYFLPNVSNIRPVAMTTEAAMDVALGRGAGGRRPGILPALGAPGIRPRRYYQARMLTMIAINRNRVRILYRVARAVRDFRRGEKTAALAEVRRALPPFRQIRRMQRQADYGKWKHWYRGEWLVGIRLTRKLVADFIRYLHDPTMTLPPPFLDNGWQGYYHIMKFEGNRTVNVR